MKYSIYAVRGESSPIYIISNLKGSFGVELTTEEYEEYTEAWDIFNDMQTMLERKYDQAVLDDKPGVY